MKQRFFSHSKLSKKPSQICQPPENLPSNKHQKQQLQIPSFNTQTVLFMFNVDRLSRVIF